MPFQSRPKFGTTNARIPYLNLHNYFGKQTNTYMQSAPDKTTVLSKEFSNYVSCFEVKNLYESTGLTYAYQKGED